MRARISVLLGWVLLCEAARPVKILTVGDSWAEYSGDSFAKYCSGAVQINRGIGGTTAAQWRRGEGETSFAKALAAAGRLSANDVVVFSLGGNDFIPGCTKPVSTLTREIEATIAALKAAMGACGADCPKIVTFGYVTPAAAKPGQGQECPAPGSFPPLAAALKAAALSTGISYFDTHTAAGGSHERWSQSALFGMCYKGTGPGTGAPCYEDTIHLNMQGYCTIVSKPEIQRFLGCTPKQYACATEHKDLDRKIRWGGMCTAFPCRRSPSPGPASAGCQDDPAGVRRASDGAFSSCSQLIKQGYPCDHEQHSELIKQLCPATCNTCNMAPLAPEHGPSELLQNDDAEWVE